MTLFPRNWRRYFMKVNIIFTTLPAKILTIFIFCTLLFPNALFSAFSYDPFLSWQTLETEHFYIHFHDDGEEQAKEVAALSEKIHKKLSVYFDWVPASRTHVVLNDRIDTPNGSATSLPYNTMKLFMVPPDDIASLGDYHNWLELLITHEYTHILQMDKASGFPEFARYFMGRFSLFFPNIFQPIWIIEGLAVHNETDKEKGVGRGQDTYYKTLMRLEVEHGIKSLRQVSQPLTISPWGSTPYLYGAYFFKFLEEKYDEEGIRNWVKEYSNNWFPYLISSSAEDTFGIDLYELWDGYKLYLKENFEPEIERIKTLGIKRGENITKTGFYNNNPRISENNNLYYVYNDLESSPGLFRIKKGEIEPKKLVNITGNRFDLHPKSGVLFVRLNPSSNANYFADLFRVNLKNGAISRLTDEGRYRSASWSPDGNRIIGVSFAQGNCRLNLLE